jgi:hypothetical protein
MSTELEQLDQEIAQLCNELDCWGMGYAELPEKVQTLIQKQRYLEQHYLEKQFKEEKSSMEALLKAIKEDCSYSLQYVHNKTNEICLTTVKDSKEPLRYIENEIDDIYLV